MDDLLFFLSYAHEDDKHKKGFVDAINPALNKNKWKIWQDGEILAGQVWNDKIKNNLKDAHVIILLVSQEFLVSEYILKVELKEALERHLNKTGLVIPIILDNCLWDETELKDIQAIVIKDKIKKDGKAALQDAAREVLESVKAYLPQKAESKEQPAAGIKPQEIAALRDLDPDALLIVVRDSQKIHLLPPGSPEIAHTFPISEQWLPQRAFAIIQRLVAEEGGLGENEYEALGEAFFFRLFPKKEAQEAFKNIYQKHSANRSEDAPLKIILHFDRASADLASLPWEYLWLPFEEDGKKGFFIGEKTDLVLTRRLSSGGEKAGALQPVEKIRILVAFSKPPSPADLAAFMEDNAKQIEAQCQALPNIEIKKQELTSEAAFKKYVAENGPFEIVHFIGKGRTENEKKEAANEIALFDPKQKDPEWLSPERFVQCFEEKDDKTKKPNLFFFNVIRDSTDFCGNLYNTALQLIDKVDGVLSIQMPVDGKQSAVFAEILYAALGQGKDLDVAAAAAARQAAQQSRRLYGISAAYSRKTLKMELAKPEKKPGMASSADNLVSLLCPVARKEPTRCKMAYFVDEKGEPSTIECTNPNCKTRPIWKCPAEYCDDRLINLHEEKCACGAWTVEQLKPKLHPKARILVEQRAAKHELAQAPSAGKQATRGAAPDTAPQNQQVSAHNKPDALELHHPSTASAVDAPMAAKGKKPPLTPVQ